MKKELNGLRLRTMVLEMSRVKDKTLLDLGAGPLGIIAARDFGCLVTSVDNSREKLKGVSDDVRGEGIEIGFEMGDATNLPHRDNIFDVVVGYGVLHHIPPVDRKKFVHEAHRVAKEMLVIAEYTPFGFNLIHPGGEYERVDLKWLEEELRGICPTGKLEKHTEKEMKVYVCQK